MNFPLFRFVVATRQDRESFFANTATGKTLKMYPYPFIELDLYESNTQGLPSVYNQSIEKAKSSPAILIFAHDDFFITDYFWMDTLINALNRFDIIGIAGCVHRVPFQPSWVFVDNQFNLHKFHNLSGIVGHGNQFPPVLDFYGPPSQEVKLLDGVFIAAKSDYLLSHDLKFDEQFSFDYYDLDFCRHAEQKGARMGTCNISLIHESKGEGFNSPQWHVAQQKYFEKWGD